MLRARPLRRGEGERCVRCETEATLAGYTHNPTPPAKPCATLMPIFLPNLSSCGARDNSASAFVVREEQVRRGALPVEEAPRQAGYSERLHGPRTLSFFAAAAASSGVIGLPSGALGPATAALDGGGGGFSAPLEENCATPGRHFGGPSLRSGDFGSATGGVTGEIGGGTYAGWSVRVELEGLRGTDGRSGSTYLMCALSASRLRLAAQGRTHVEGKSPCTCGARSSEPSHHSSPFCAPAAGTSSTSSAAKESSSDAAAA